MLRFSPTSVKRLSPPVRPLASQEQRQLSALITRRRQLVEMRTAEKNRRSSCPPSLRQEIEAHLKWLQERIKQINREIEQLSQNSESWQQRMNLLRSVPGVGLVIASTKVAELPEARSTQWQTDFSTGGSARLWHEIVASFAASA